MASGRQIAALFRMIPEPVWLKDPHGIYLAGNARFEELYGVQEAELLGKTDYDFVSADEAASYRSRDLAAIAAGKPLRNEEWLTFAVGGYRGLFETVKTPLYDEEGVLLGVIGVARDITALKQAEEELQQSEQQYLSLLNNTPAILYRYSDRRGGLYYSPRVEEFLGHTPQHLLVNPLLWHDSIHPDDLSLVEAAVVTLQSGRGFDIEYRIRHRNGAWRWFHDQSISQLHEDGEVVVDGIAEDITLRKQAEEALQEERCLLAMHVEERTVELTLANRLLIREITQRERTMNILKENEERIKLSETLLRSVTDGTTDLIFIKDRTGRFLFANPATQHHFGLKSHEILGRSVFDCFPDPSIGQAIIDHELALMESDRTETVEESLPTPAGARSFLTTKSPRHNSEGKVIGLIGIAHDITDRKQAEAVLAEQKHHDRLNMELVLAGARERRRVSAVLHDQIGQNLLLQKLKLRMLEDSIDTPPVLQTLSEIRELLDESIAGIRSLTVQLCPPILATLGLTAAVEWLGKKFKSDYNLLVDVLDDGAPKPLDQERREVVYQAIRELLINITKHAGTERAKLTLARDGEQLIVVIADQGRGCRQSVKGGSSGGDGYGLHFIQRNMEHFGGTMTIVSEPGEGTRVTLHFPLMTA